MDVWHSGVGRTPCRRHPTHDRRIRSDRCHRIHTHQILASWRLERQAKKSFASWFTTPAPAIQVSPSGRSKSIHERFSLVVQRPLCLSLEIHNGGSRLSLYWIFYTAASPHRRRASNNLAQIPFPRCTICQYEITTESTDGFKFEGVKKNQALGTQHTPGSSKTVSNKVWRVRLTSFKSSAFKGFLIHSLLQVAMRITTSEILRRCPIRIISSPCRTRKKHGRFVRYVYGTRVLNCCCFNRCCVRQVSLTHGSHI
jgi:hypothetical protein